LCHIDVLVSSVLGDNGAGIGVNQCVGNLEVFDFLSKFFAFGLYPSDKSALFGLNGLFGGMFLLFVLAFVCFLLGVGRCKLEREPAIISQTNARTMLPVGDVLEFSSNPRTDVRIVFEPSM
jgi:hypothetical protein